ncbi:Conserved_hypothetical protein [Hexamita inflata]|uniref:Transmembrane protein n=1 Tax=Hexamita inflata TaxID=28002 RepID=A0AA86PHR3_9EUKA|nr:Conserved hypothetical protein [Hexamita inflata]
MIETLSVQDKNQNTTNLLINYEKLRVNDQLIPAISQNNTGDYFQEIIFNNDDLRKPLINSNSKLQKKVQRINVISPRLSYWINVQRCLMCIIVIVSHITPMSYEEKSIFTALIQHPFVANGRACVQVFFTFAAIFSMHSMLGLYEKHQNSTKDFTKAFLFQYIKRYFSTISGSGSQGRKWSELNLYIIALISLIQFLCVLIFLSLLVNNRIFEQNLIISTIF